MVMKGDTGEYDIWKNRVFFLKISAAAPAALQYPGQ